MDRLTSVDAFSLGRSAAAAPFAALAAAWFCDPVGGTDEAWPPAGVGR